MQRTPKKPCGYCESLTHYPYQCWKNPYLKRFGWKGSKNPKQPKSRLGRGKHAELWKRARREWFIANPAETYTCYLQISPICPRVMTPAETTLDHVKSRSRRPDLRYELSNLRPSCLPCNVQKSSFDLEDLGLADVA